MHSLANGTAGAQAISLAAVSAAAGATEAATGNVCLTAQYVDVHDVDADSALACATCVAGVA